MISLVVAAVLLLIHALVCLVLWTLMKLGLLPVRGHMLPVIVLVPLWGPLLVVLLSVCSAVFGEGLNESALESLRFNDDLHRSILVHERDADAGVIPLEEALIVNDPADRRRLMLSMLTEEPDAYLAQLQAAKLNDDVEVAHYAATAVAQISKESDLKLQQLERAFKTDPSAQNLNEYCDFLGEYLNSGLAEGRVAQIQRQQYARLLARRCEREDALELRIRFATALADAGQIDEAQAVIDQLVLDVPEEQEVWMLCLRLAVMRHDGDEVHRVIDAIDKQHVYLSAANRDVFQRVDKLQILARIVIHRGNELCLCLRDCLNLRRDDIAEVLQADIALALHAEAGQTVAGDLRQEGAGNTLNAKGEAGVLNGAGVANIVQALQEGLRLFRRQAVQQRLNMGVRIAELCRGGNGLFRVIRMGNELN